MSGLQAAVEAAALQDQLKLIYEDMPRDLQQTMLSSPHRAVLLQGPGPQIKVRLPDCATLISEASCIPCLLLQTQVENASSNSADQSSSDHFQFNYLDMLSARWG